MVNCHGQLDSSLEHTKPQRGHSGLRRRYEPYGKPSLDRRQAPKGVRSFNYLDGKTVEWIVRGPELVTIKMSVVQGDDNLAQIEFFDANGINVGRGGYVLRCSGVGGQIAPYFGERYVVDYRDDYVMVGPDGGTIFALHHQKQQSFTCDGVDYVVRHPSGAIKTQRTADIVE